WCLDACKFHSFAYLKKIGERLCSINLTKIYQISEVTYATIPEIVTSFNQRAIANPRSTRRFVFQAPTYPAHNTDPCQTANAPVLTPFLSDSTNLCLHQPPLLP
ncbi:hypothetical protein J0895_08900, partial [Phormidium pseudopriestleyi FRX01]